MSARGHSRFPSDRTARVIRWACALLFAGPCLTNAADPKPVAAKSATVKTPVINPISDRYRQIEQMSKLDRDRLQRNITEFQKLSDEEQARYRELHQKLAENKASNGQLSILLREYTTWLTTLTPSQRDELSNATDPSKKLALVKQFKHEQDAVHETAPTESPNGSAGDPRPLPPLPRGLPPGSFLLQPELAAVMKVIANEVGLERDKSSHESLPVYYRDVLKTSIQQTPGGGAEWPGRELMPKLEAAIERQELKDRIRRNPELKRQTMIHLIVGGIFHKAIEETKGLNPTPLDLQQTFGSLDQREQERLMSVPDFERKGILVGKFFASHKDDPRPRMRDLREQLDRLLTTLGVPHLQRPPGGEGRVGPGGFPRDRMPERPDGGRPPRRPGNE